MYGNGLKNESSNKDKIIIYQMPLLERLIGIFSAMVLTSIPVVCLILGYESKLEIIILLLCMILYCIFIYFNAFKTYICLDIKNQKLIIREDPGIHSIKIDMDDVIDLHVVDGVEYKYLFTIDINYISGHTKKIKSWSHHPSCRLAMFNVYGRQTKRLKKFCYECNCILSKLINTNKAIKE